jgi:ABC transporter
MATPAVVVEDLHVAYGGRIWALDGVDVDADAGSTLGVLGHNGAGKTTLIRVLTTLVRPTTGRDLVDGLDVVTDAAQVRRRVGVTGQYAGLDDFLTAVDGRHYTASSRRATTRRTPASTVRWSSDGLCRASANSNGRSSGLSESWADPANDGGHRPNAAGTQTFGGPSSATGCSSRWAGRCGSACAVGTFGPHPTATARGGLTGRRSSTQRTRQATWRPAQSAIRSSRSSDADRPDRRGASARSVRATGPVRRRDTRNSLNERAGCR